MITPTKATLLTFMILVIFAVAQTSVFNYLPLFRKRRWRMTHNFIPEKQTPPILVEWQPTHNEISHGWGHQEGDAQQDYKSEW